MRVLLKILFFILFLFSSVFTNVQADEACSLVALDNHKNSIYNIINESEDYYLIVNNNNFEISVLDQKRDKDFSKGGEGFCKNNIAIALGKLAERPHYKLGSIHKISTYLTYNSIRAP